ncbi:Fe-S-containing protein, partial [Chloroflexota bacterium]
PVSEVKDNINTHFGIETDAGKMNYMAYLLDDQIHVRANICPPCRSIGFTLQKDILVCDRCKTTFEAGTGNGIQGACVDYPKAAVSYSIIDDKIEMSVADLKAATEDTKVPG